MKTRPVFKVLLIGFLLLSWGCGGKQNSSLSVGVNPNQPLLIPYSSATNSSSTTTGPVAPYFAVNSLKLSWAGTQKFQLLALTFYASSLGTTGSSSSTTGGSSFNCSGSGSAITAIFAAANIVDCHNNPPGGVVTPALDANLNLTIPAPADPNCPNSVQSAGFFCDSLPITVNPNPFTTYNIPVEVVVFGEGLDTGGNATGRVSAITNITID